MQPTRLPARRPLAPGSQRLMPVVPRFGPGVLGGPSSPARASARWLGLVAISDPPWSVSSETGWNSGGEATGCKPHGLGGATARGQCWTVGCTGARALLGHMPRAWHRRARPCRGVDSEMDRAREGEAAECWGSRQGQSTHPASCPGHPTFCPSSAPPHTSSHKSSRDWSGGGLRGSRAGSTYVGQVSPVSLHSCAGLSQG